MKVKIVRLMLFRIIVSALFLSLICLPASSSVLSVNKASQVKLLVFPDDGVEPILSLIHKAKKSIDLVMYAFTHAGLVKALIEAEQRGVAVRVMLQPSPYKMDSVNNNVILQLLSSGVALTGSNPAFRNTHQKSLIIDDKLALISGFNYTTTSFISQRDFAVLVSNPNSVAEVESVFNADWLRTKAVMKRPELVWSPTQSSQKIADFIASSEHSLSLYNQGFSDIALAKALIRRSQQGVKVRVLVSHKKTNFRVLNLLVCNGVAARYFTHGHLHAKAMLADYNTATERSFVGSANFTPVGLKRNRELGIVMSDKAVAQRLYRTFQSDWDREAVQKCDKAA